MSDRGTRALVVVKEGTSSITAQTRDTETRVEGMKLIASSLIKVMITPLKNLSSKRVIITLL